MNVYRLPENTIALYTIVRREIARFIRIWPQTLLPPVITMTLYIVIFGNLMGARIGEMGGVQYIHYIIPGLIMMSVLTNAYANVVASFFGSKFQRNIEEMLVSPMSAHVILWGFVLGGVARGLCVGGLVTGVAYLFAIIQVQHVGITLLVVLLTAILFSLAGLLNGLFAKKFDDINIIPTFVLTPLTYLGGVFYSVAILPEFWQRVSLGNPIFYMVNAFRFGLLNQADVDIGLSVGVLFGLISVLYVISVWALSRGLGLRT